jgi:hypothetical protein
VDKKTLYFTNVLATQSTLNSTPSKHMVNFCSKLVVNSLFLYFYGTSMHNHVAKNAQGLKGRMPKEKFVLLIGS